MLYVLQCKCQHLEFDHSRKCMACSKKFKNNGIMNKEYNVIEARYTSIDEHDKVFYDPLKSLNELNKETRPLYFLQCPCGCLDFDEKRRCTECGKKFKNNFFRNDYQVIRYDWMIQVDGVYYYKWDKDNHKPMDTLEEINDARQIERDKKYAKSMRRAERKVIKNAEENAAIRAFEKPRRIKKMNQEQMQKLAEQHFKEYLIRMRLVDKDE